ncbi:MAG TPA: DUF4097 family beta strand repeat-containing protein, partial [Candidatus Baltobacteraceae bacterium]|nr:DUF4097 family beta strand repeat-containing protein [Candidatus Baltobacteraceae bacterium]
MQYSRTGIVAVLLAVEVFLAGAMLWSLGGHNFSAQAAGMHRVDDGSHAFAPMYAGRAPHVILDDPDSGVTISNSTDGSVRVTDDSQMHGWFFGNHSRPPLSVRAIPGGVAIERPGDGVHVAMFGFDDEHVTIAIPPQSALEVRRCSGARINGLRGSVRVNSVDGRITLQDVRAASLFVRSADGSLHMNDVSAPSIDAATQDGSIRAYGLQVGGGTLATQDGSITVALQ